ncbi:hypothetical protein LTR95_014412 [Oleoguttula sp. CCFEE 5521]
MGRIKWPSCKWITPGDLQEYFPDGDYIDATGSTDIDDDVAAGVIDHLQEKRRAVFKLDLPQLMDADYWDNYIVNDKAAAPLMQRRISSTSTSPASPSRSYCSGTALNDDGSMSWSRPSSKSDGQRKRKFSTVQDDNIADSNSTVRLSKPEVNRAIIAQRAKSADHEYIVIAGSRSILKVVPRPAARRIDVLTGMVRHNGAYGHYISLTITMPQITAKGFKAVAEYLSSGEFHPELNCLPAAIDFQEGDETEPVVQAAKDIALAYHASSWLQMGHLQADCMRKLRYMGALSGLALMGVEAGSRGCDQWGMEERRSLHELALHGLARDFFKIMEIDGVLPSTYLQEKKSPMMVITRRLRASIGG